MPSVAVQLYSVISKLLLRHRLQARLQNPPFPSEFGLTCRPDESVAAANPTFADGVATKDVHIDLVTSLSVRIFLPDSNGISPAAATDAVYKGYLPPRPEPEGRGGKRRRRLPVVLQFHGGGFVEGSNVSASNDFFCRRIAKLCGAIVVAVGYRLAPESRYPAAFDDGMEALKWLGKQANLAEYGRSMGRRVGEKRDMVRTFGDDVAEPWIAAHGDPSRCVLLGVSCGANIANSVARRAVEAGKLVRPVKVVAQVLMYPFFMGGEPTRTETKLANSYFYDRATCVLAWKLLLTEEDFSPDHPAANPLAPGQMGGPHLSLRQMPPTLTVVAEHDWMRDRAVAYSEELRKLNVDAPVLEYKDSVHDFATLHMLLNTPKAQACAEDIAIWVSKYISTPGHEFSY